MDLIPLSFLLFSSRRNWIPFENREQLSVLSTCGLSTPSTLYYTSGLNSPTYLWAKYKWLKQTLKN